MKRIMTLMIAATLLTGCNVYRKYTPTTNVDKNLYGEEYASDDTASIASLSWHELFQDAHLQRLIDTALVRNTDLRTAHLRVEQAEAALMNARLSYLPSVSLTADGNISRLEGTTTKTYTVGASAGWEIDIFGRLTSAKREARESLEASRAYRQAVQTRLVATVATEYYTLLMLDEQLRISRETLDSWKETVRTLRALKRGGGGITEAAVLQAEANCLEVLTAQQSLLTARQALLQARFDEIHGTISLYHALGGGYER